MAAATSPNIAQHLRMREEHLRAGESVVCTSPRAEVKHATNGERPTSSRSAGPLTPSVDVIGTSDREVDRLWKERTYLRQRCRKLEAEVESLRTQVSRFRENTPTSTVEDMLYEEIENQRNDIHQQKDVIEALQVELKQQRSELLRAKSLQMPQQSSSQESKEHERVKQLEHELNSVNKTNKSLKQAIKAMQDGLRDMEKSTGPNSIEPATTAHAATAVASAQIEQARALVIAEKEDETNAQFSLNISSHMLTLAGLVGWVRQEINYRIPNHGMVHEALRDVHEAMQEIACGSDELEKRRLAGEDSLDQKWQEQLLLKPPTPKSPKEFTFDGIKSRQGDNSDEYEHAAVVHHPVAPVPELDTSAINSASNGWQSFEVASHSGSCDTSNPDASDAQQYYRSSRTGSQNGSLSTRSEQQHHHRSLDSGEDVHRPLNSSRQWTRNPESTRSLNQKHRPSLPRNSQPIDQLANDSHAWRLLAEQFNINVPRARKMGSRTPR